MIGIKQNILYNGGSFANSDHAYGFACHPNPYMEVDATYSFNKLDLLAGLSLYPTKYWIEYEYSTPKASFEQHFGLGLTTAQLPVRVLYNITNKLKIGFGVALNFHSFYMQSYKDNFSGQDDFDLEWDASSDEFNNYFSVSNQLQADFELYRHWGLNFIADIDWRGYPSFRLKDVIYRGQQVIKKSSFFGSPKMLYLTLTLSYRI